ncbi:MAG: SH3 domain-containing protein [Chloroflexi bacterium OHK40]
MSTQQEETAPGPLELLESARAKYTLGVARLRRGPPELALLSIHGSVEDVLRAHGLRLGLPAAYESFPELLSALTQVRELPLSAAEAEGVRRMHRLRARVAHGEQIVVARETLEAYQLLAARLLPRYGVLVAPPETTGDTVRVAQPAGAPRPHPRPRVDTGRIERVPAREAPRRERTTFPDEGLARYTGRARPSRATSDLPLARELEAGRRRRGGPGEWLGQAQNWLLPAVAILTIFLVGAAISVGLQRLRAEPPVPTAAVPTFGASAPVISPVPTAASFTNAVDSAVDTLPAAPVATAGPPDAPTATVLPPEGLAPGRRAVVREDAVALNVRARAGTALDNPVLFSLAPGSEVEIVAGPVEADGFTWWQVRGPLGEGWCAGQFLDAR